MKRYLMLLLMATNALATGYDLTQATATYTVRHLVKTVKGESRSAKGKMSCEQGVCEFLVAIPVKSFVSSDSNRDLNMLTVLEATKYPLITFKGNLPEGALKKDKFSFTSLVNFHGVEKSYPVIIEGHQGHFTLLLEDHKVERPSLLTVSIKNEVPIDFSFGWK